MVDKPVLVWDEYEILKDQVDYVLDNPEEFPEYDGLDHDALWSRLSETVLECEWDWLTDALTELMEAKNKRYKYPGYWYAEVNNFGWRGLDGHATIEAETGQELLRKVLPKTDCIFRIYHDGRGIKIQNFHHDSPVGKEWYYIQPMNAKEVEEWEGWH